MSAGSWQLWRTPVFGILSPQNSNTMGATLQHLSCFRKCSRADSMAFLQHRLLLPLTQLPHVFFGTKVSTLNRAGNDRPSRAVVSQTPAFSAGECSVFSVQFSVNRFPLSTSRFHKPYRCCEMATSWAHCCISGSSCWRNASKRWVFWQHQCCRTANTCALRCSKRPFVQQIGALATFCHRILRHRTLAWARLPDVPSFRLP